MTVCVHFDDSIATRKYSGQSVSQTDSQSWRHGRRSVERSSG